MGLDYGVTTFGSLYFWFIVHRVHGLCGLVTNVKRSARGVHTVKEHLARTRVHLRLISFCYENIVVKAHGWVAMCVWVRIIVSD